MNQSATHTHAADGSQPDQAPVMTDEEILAALAGLSARERWIVSEMIRLILCDPGHAVEPQKV